MNNNGGRNFFNGAGLDDMPQQNSMNSFDNSGMMNNTPQPMDNGMGMNTGFGPQPMDMPMMNNDMGMNSNNGFIDMSQSVNMNNQNNMNTGFNDMPQQSPMNTFDNSGMMGSTPQPMDNGMNAGFGSQPMDMPAMNNNMNNNMNNMGMNQPMGMTPQPMMNNNMGMSQQNVVQPMGGATGTPKGKFNFAENKGGILIAVASVAVIGVLLVLFVFHKTISCSADIGDTELGAFMDFSDYGIEITVDYKQEFWFGKPTSAAMIMTVDFSEYDEDEMGMDKDDFKDSIKDSLGDEYEVEDKGDKLVMTMVADKDDLEDSDDYDDVIDEMEDMGLTCK